MSLTKAEVIVLIKAEVKSLTSYLEDAHYSSACDDASRETGWTFPVATSFRELWIKERAKRYLYSYLLAESQHKFKIKQINLQHRWEHYRATIKDMDRDWFYAKSEHPEEFIGGLNKAHLFGTKIDAGFSSDLVGNDTTYMDDNVVEFTPKETD